MACSLGNNKAAEEIIRAGSTLLIKDHAGFTALHQATEHGMDVVVSLMLQQPANELSQVLNVLTQKTCQTAYVLLLFSLIFRLLIACSKNFTSIACSLIKAGANISIKDKLTNSA